MNIEEIRKNAPSDATHYVDAEVEIVFLRLFSGGWQCYVFFLSCLYGSEPHIQDDLS